MTEVRIHPAAEAEYEQAFAWYSERSSRAADQFEVAFDEAIGRIQANPTMFPCCDERHHFVLLNRYPYSLIYRVEDEIAHIIAVAHSKRRSGYWANRG